MEKFLIVTNVVPCIDVEVKDKDGSTPLHHVAKKLQIGATKVFHKIFIKNYVKSF